MNRAASSTHLELVDPTAWTRNGSDQNGSYQHNFTNSCLAKSDCALIRSDSYAVEICVLVRTRAQACIANIHTV